MEENKNCITVVFTGVPDTAQLESAIKDAIQYPVIQKKEQNNGTVCYVVQGILPENADSIFNDFLKNNNLDNVEVIVHDGNIFVR
jgi:hypothetical protein